MARLVCIYYQNGRTHPVERLRDSQKEGQKLNTLVYKLVTLLQEVKGGGGILYWV